MDAKYITTASEQLSLTWVTIYTIRLTFIFLSLYNLLSQKKKKNKWEKTAEKVIFTFKIFLKNL